MVPVNRTESPVISRHRLSAKVISTMFSGRSSGFRIIQVTRPSHSTASAVSQWQLSSISSPITAAGPRRICTVFPFHPRLHMSQRPVKVTDT